jgi:SWI/SNF-related matrix-associated actin-dependent regulator 1 of chromatin subfamily A
MISIDIQDGVFYLDIPYNSGARTFLTTEHKKRFDTVDWIRWDKGNSLWYVKDSSYKSVQDLMRYARDTLKERTHLSDEALDKLIVLENYEERSSWKHDDNLPPIAINGLKSNLRFYQNTCIRFLQDAGGRGIVALGTGVGKSLTALAWTIWQNKKAIIVAPSQRGRTKHSWVKEIRKHTYKRAKIVWGSTQMDLMSFIGADYIIINYELLAKFRDMLTLLINIHGFDTIIVDESHSIKSFKTKRTKEVLHLANMCEHRILLSATAIKNKPQELFTQLHLVAPDRFKDWKEFLAKYCHTRFYDRVSKTYKSGKASKKQMEDLNRDIGGIYFYRDKMDLLTELPPLTVETVMYDLDKLNDYTDIETQILRGELPLLAGKQKQHKLLAKAMIQNTVDMVLDKLVCEENNKIIIYSGFIHIVEALKEALGDRFVMSHGQLPRDEADENFDRFMEDDEVDGIVATYQSFSESLNLQGVANVVLYNDCPHVSAVLAQGLGRIHRIGSDKMCYGYIMGFKDSYYEDIFERVEEKNELLTKVLEGKDVESPLLDQTIVSKGK